MDLATTDELDRTDEAFARNRLLATFSPEARALIEPYASVVDFDLGSVINASGADVDHSYFPFGPTMISLRLGLTDGRTIEVASIGQEGRPAASSVADRSRPSPMPRSSSRGRRSRSRCR